MLKLQHNIYIIFFHKFDRFFFFLSFIIFFLLLLNLYLHHIFQKTNFQMKSQPAVMTVLCLCHWNQNRCHLPGNQKQRLPPTVRR